MEETIISFLRMLVVTRIGERSSMVAKMEGKFGGRSMGPLVCHGFKKRIKLVG